MFACVGCVTGGWCDKTGFSHCTCDVSSSKNPHKCTHVCPSAHVLSRCRILCGLCLTVHSYVLCACEDLCPCVCVLSFPASCPCFVSSTVQHCLFGYSQSRESLYCSSEMSDSLLMFQPQLSDDCSPLPQLTGSQIVFVVLTAVAAQFDLRKTELGNH